MFFIVDFHVRLDCLSFMHSLRHGLGSRVFEATSTEYELLILIYAYSEDNIFYVTLENRQGVN